MSVDVELIGGPHDGQKLNVRSPLPRIRCVDPCVRELELRHVWDPPALPSASTYRRAPLRSAIERGSVIPYYYEGS